MSTCLQCDGTVKSPSPFLGPPPQKKKKPVEVSATFVPGKVLSNYRTGSNTGNKENEIKIDFEN